MLKTTSLQFAVFVLDSAALAAILLLRGFTFWLPMIPGFFLVREVNYVPGR